MSADPDTYTTVAQAESARKLASLLCDPMDDKPDDVVLAVSLYLRRDGTMQMGVSMEAECEPQRRALLMGVLAAASQSVSFNMEVV